MPQAPFFATMLVFLTTWGSVCLAQDGYPLTVVTPKGEERALFLQELDAMKQIEFSTATIWTDGETSFSGVPVAHLLDVLDVGGTTLRMSALNDYSVEMPVADLGEDAPIIATRMNGETIPVRDKGPYWIVFPYDRNPEYRTEVNYARSVWQLQTLTLGE